MNALSNFLLIALLSNGFLAIAQPAAAQAVHFSGECQQQLVPPGQGMPGRVQGGGTR